MSASWGVQIACRACCDLDGDQDAAYPPTQSAGMVKRYHASFPSLSYGFDSRYPLQPTSV